VWGLRSFTQLPARLPLVLLAEALTELSQLRAIFSSFAIIFAAKPCVSIATL